MSGQDGPVPNITLRNWRARHHLSRAELADKINRSQAGIADRLACDDERVRRWESGEVRWPSPAYRRALRQLTGLDPGQLDTLQEAADLLCRAYPSAPAPELRARVKQRLRYVARLLSGRTTLRQHRELVVTAGWLSLLLGCLHYDLGEREEAEAARQAAYHAGMQAGHGEIIAWSCELAAWFALTEGRYQDVVGYADAGQQHAGLTNAMVQLVLQQARGLARLGERGQVRARAWTAVPDSSNSSPAPNIP